MSDIDFVRFVRSEEDNDPMTDDAASTISMTLSRGQHTPSSPLAGSRPPASAQLGGATRQGSLGGAMGGGGAGTGVLRAARQHTSTNNHISGVISDDGVDSPTYDGDIETNTNVRTAHYHSSAHPHVSAGSSHSSVSTLTSPASGTFPAGSGITGGGRAGAPAVTITSVSRQSSVPSSATTGAGPNPFSQGVNAKPLRVAEEPAPVPVAESEFNPADLTPEDIREFVGSAIAGGPTEKGAKRLYKINPPPVGRPVRIYADGEQDSCFMIHF